MDSIELPWIEQALNATAPRRRPRLILQLLFISVFVSFFVLAMPGVPLSLRNPAFLAVPLILFLSLIGLNWRIAQARRRDRERLNAAWEKLQLADTAGALADLYPLLSRPISDAADRGRAWLLLGRIAAERDETDSAVQIFEQILIQRIGESELWQEAQIRLLDAKIRNHELTDAVDGISRLLGTPMNPVRRAEFDLVHLHQQVFMGHHADAAGNVAERAAGFRQHLSTGAAHGYALLAAAMHYLNRPEEAQRWWTDATMLVRPERLLKAYPLLATVHAVYRAAEHPL